MTSEINDTDFEKFTLSLFNSKKSPLFDIQVLSRHIKSEDKVNLNIRFRPYLAIQEDSVDNGCLNIEDTSSVSDIYSFTSSIRAFLSELSRKETDK